MYLEHFGLNKEPFHITPDPYFFYMSPSHKESYASMIYGLRNKKGFISLTGEVGLGKTTVIRTFLKKWSDRKNIKTVFIFNSNLSFKGLLLTIYSELGLDLPAKTGSSQNKDDFSHALPLEDETFELVRELHRVLINEYQEGCNVILIIDDAQNMPVETLENLRMLSNLETSKDKLLQIFLIGQTELNTLLDKKELRQLRQRIAIRATLKPLSTRQSRDYILHRLRKSVANNGDEHIFTRGAIKKIHRYSRGIPRKINIICDNALITGFGYDRKKINAGIIKEVQADLEGKPANKKFRYALAFCIFILMIPAVLWFSSYRENFLVDIEKLTPWNFNVLTGKVDQTDASPKPFPSISPEPNPKNKRLKAGDEDINSVQGSVYLPEVKPGHSTGIAIDSTLSGEGVLAFMNNALEEKSQGVNTADHHQTTSGTENSANDQTRDSIPQEVSSENLPIHQELARLIPVYQDLSRTRQETLIRMARQTTISSLMGFERMLGALERNDYEEAAREMLQSQWADAVGGYAHDLAEAMRTDKPMW